MQRTRDLTQWENICPKNTRPGDPVSQHLKANKQSQLIEDRKEEVEEKLKGKCP